MTAPPSPALNATALAARYDFFRRATQRNSGSAVDNIERPLEELRELLHKDLLALARRGSPDDFAEIYFALEQELARFGEFCAFPTLAQKFVVAFGGAVSAGKSSFINALFAQEMLPVDIGATSALPSYLLHGDTLAHSALNLYGHRITLTEEEFLSLNHNEEALYGSQIASLLRAAFVTCPEFRWHNLAFSDTPGYTKPDNPRGRTVSDEAIARAQLNAAQAIVWFVPASAGTISESDLAFLATLDPGIPRLVLVSCADEREHRAIADIVQGISNTLAGRNLPAIDVIPVSAHDEDEYPFDRALTYFDDWNQQTRELRFARNFKQHFTRYARFIEGAQRNINLRLNRLQRILAATPADEVGLITDAQELTDDARANLAHLNVLSDELRVLRKQFFTRLKAIGDAAGVPLPEPAEIELIDIETFDLLGLLHDLRMQHQRAEPSHNQALRPLALTRELPSQAALLRRNAQRYSSIWARLNQQTGMIIPSVLRPRTTSHHLAALQLLA